MTAADHFQIGRAALLRGLTRQALQHFARAHALHPPSPTYRSNYGLLLGLIQGDHRRAVELIESAISLDSRNPEHHVNLARVHLEVGDIESTARSLYAALDLDPSNRQVILRLKDLELRGPVAIPFLSRAHILNRALGRLRSTFRQSAEAA